jgi:hypothetical protein
MRGIQATQPSYQFVNQEGGGLQQIKKNPFGTPDITEPIPPTYKPKPENWKPAHNPETKKNEYYDMDKKSFTGVLVPVGAGGGISGDTGFADLEQNAKDTWFETYKNTGKLPPFAFRDAPSRNSFTKGYAEYLQRTGTTPNEAILAKVETDALRGSMNLQQKTYGMMGSFINNLASQVARVKQMQADTIKRVGIRGIDIPIREFKTRFLGSGQERVLESYLMEISREIGKLSTGSQASIAELSVEAQKKWDKIHDPNLSLKDLGEVLDATMEQAYLRRSGAAKELDATKEEVKNIGKKPKKESTPVMGRIKKLEDMTDEELRAYEASLTKGK